MKYRQKIFSILSANMSTSSKGKSHYSNLGIDSKATQDQVKTAYFKKSMEYHPDRNNSEEAKVKFREISEAYEVLGSYEKRKNYDRGMRIRTSSDIPRGKVVRTQQDFTKEAFRVRTALYRHSNPSPNEKIYDFDAWTKAHYGDVFRKQQKDKRNVEFHREFDANSNITRNSIRDISVLSICLIFGFLLICTQTSMEKFEPDTTSQYEKKLVNVAQTNPKTP